MTNNFNYYKPNKIASVCLLLKIVNSVLRVGTYNTFYWYHGPINVKQPMKIQKHQMAVQSSYETPKQSTPTMPRAGLELRTFAPSVRTFGHKTTEPGSQMSYNGVWLLSFHDIARPYSIIFYVINNSWLQQVENSSLFIKFLIDWIISL